MRRADYKMMSFEIICILLAVVFVCFFLLAASSFGLSYEENVAKWARANDFEILNLTECDVSETSFNWLLTSKDAVYFRIKIKTKNGETRKGHLWTSGSFFNALYRMPPRVVWETELDEL